MSEKWHGNIDPRKRQSRTSEGWEDMIETRSDAHREYQVMCLRLRGNQLSFSPQARILEVGSGNGVFTKYLLEMGHDVVALDARPRGHADIPVAQLRAEELPFDETDTAQRFDLIIEHAVFDPNEYEQDLKAIFSEFGRVLEKGGIVYCNSLHITEPELIAALPQSLKLAVYEGHYAILVKE